MSENVVGFPGIRVEKQEIEGAEPMKLSEWLRSLADEIEKEEDETYEATIVLTNEHTDDGKLFRLRSRRFGHNVVEAIGYMTMACHDFGAL
jgi:hypothetical protein